MKDRLISNRGYRPEMRIRRATPAIITVAALVVSGLVPLDAQAAPAYVANPAGYVNPFIGTTGGGNTFPGATVPFGMLSFSPDQNYYTGGAAGSQYNNMGYLRTASPSGYAYARNTIRGFSLTHVSGPGCAGLSGDFPFMPIPGEVTQAPTVDEANNPVQSTFSHENEQASAGYYRVGLDSGVDVQLSATERAGVGRFTFPAGNAGSILLRTSDAMLGSTDAQINIDPATRTVTGSVTSGNFCGYVVGNGELRRPYYTIHFVAQFDQPFTAVGTWEDKVLRPGTRAADGGSTIAWNEALNANGGIQSGYPSAGKGSGGYLQFNTSSNRTVNVRTAISYVSVDNAKLNLASEIPQTRSLEDVRDAAVAKWNQSLGQIQIAGGTEDERTVFYTALYHALLSPSLAEDVNRQYRAFDGDRSVKTLPASQEHQYHTFSGWDVYRGQTQLLALLDPKMASDYAQSLYNQAKENRYNDKGLRVKPGDADQGRDEWDRWTHVQGGTHVMVGDPSAPALAGIVAFGGTEFDVAGAYASLADAARVPTARDLSRRGWNISSIGQRPSLDQFLRYGYYPNGCVAWGCPAETLEMGAADYGLAELAEYLGKPADQQEFEARSNSWQNNFDSNAVDNVIGFKGWIRNRANTGLWQGNFNASSSSGMVEGTAAHYVWLVQHNLAGLVDAMGGRDIAERRLDEFFHDQATGDWDFRGSWSTNFNSNLDNEPDIHSPWIYNYTNAPWKTQETVREVIRILWLQTPDGIPHGPDGVPGNDDLGTMSSWLVFAAMGMYPYNPSTADMTYASPLFPNIKLTRKSGETITINAPGADMDTFYTQSLSVDGKPTSLRYLPASHMAKGVSTTLDYALGKAPNKAWGAGAANEPPAGRYGEKVYTTTVNPPSTTAGQGMPTASVQLRSQIVNQSASPSTVTFQAEAANGIKPVPASGTLSVDADGIGTANLVYQVGSEVAPGSYPMKVHLYAGGEQQRDVQVDVIVGERRTAFYSGLETGQTASTTNTQLEGSGISGFNGTGAVNSQAIASSASTGDYAFVGSRAFRYAGRANELNARATQSVFDVTASNLTAVAGSTFSYWVRPQAINPPDNTGLELDASPFVALDLEFSDGSRLSQAGAVASNGAALTPEAQGGVLRFDTWQHVSVTLPESVDGKQISRVILNLAPGSHYYDVASANHGYLRGHLDEVMLSQPTAPVHFTDTVPAEIRAGETVTAQIGLFGGGLGTKASDFKAVVDWGDNTPVSALKVERTSKGFALSGSHKFAAAAQYPGTVTLTDVDGYQQEFSVTFTVAEPRGFYKPVAGVLADSKSVLAGGIVKFYATGLKANETVQVRVNTKPLVSFETTADSTGRVDYPFVVPAKAALGSYVITVTGRESNTPASTTFSVVTRTAVTVSATASPASAAHGSPVKVTAKLSKATATGKVVFTAGGKTLGTATVSKGSATLTLSTLAVGSHKITAAYSGDPLTLAASATVTAKVVKTKVTSIKVSGKKFAKNSKPKITVKLSKLTNGKYPTGKVKVYVGGKAVKTVSLSAAKKGSLSVTLPKKYKASIKVKAKYLPTSSATTLSATSKQVTIKRK